MLQFLNKKYDIKTGDNSEKMELEKLREEIKVYRQKYNNEDIAIIHYPNGRDMEINGGHFIEICNNNILHSVSTEDGSSGSPIILLLRKKRIISRLGSRSKFHF